MSSSGAATKSLLVDTDDDDAHHLNNHHHHHEHAMPRDDDVLSELSDDDPPNHRSYDAPAGWPLRSVLVALLLTAIVTASLTTVITNAINASGHGVIRSDSGASVASGAASCAPCVCPVTASVVAPAIACPPPPASECPAPPPAPECAACSAPTAAAECPAASSSPTNASVGVNPSSPEFCADPTRYPVAVDEHVAPFCVSPYPMTPYVPPVTLTRSDLVIGLLSMDAYKFSRDEYVLHSWLNPVRAPFAFFACSVPRDASLLQPCLDIPDTSDAFISNINKTLLGLRELYYARPDAKWYWLSGDDDFINVDHTLSKLEALDHTQPLFVGGDIMKNERCAHDNQPVSFISGGPGMLASHALMAATHHLISPWVEQTWMRGTPGTARNAGDVAVACFFKAHGYSITHLPGFAWSNALEPADEGLHNQKHSDYHVETNNWHYVEKDRFLHADIFFSLQLIDRMQRNGQIALLGHYARELVIERFHQQKRSLALIVPAGDPTKV